MFVVLQDGVCFSTSKLKLKHYWFYNRIVYLNFWPQCSSEFTVRTFECVGVQVRPLVVLHVGASMKSLHADPTAEAFGVDLLGLGR